MFDRKNWHLHVQREILHYTYLLFYFFYFSVLTFIVFATYVQNFTNNYPKSRFFSIDTYLCNCTRCIPRAKILDMFRLGENFSR